MSEHVIEYDAMCESCKGSGLYVGLGEREGAAVVCHTCKGTGKVHVKTTYKDPPDKQIRKEGLSRVFAANPGICIGDCVSGGMPYEDWLAGKPFPKGSEMRGHTCPAWWYQSADCTKKPDWENCNYVGERFSDCPHFGVDAKRACWERWDKEFGEK